MLKFILMLLLAIYHLDLFAFEATSLDAKKVKIQLLDIIPYFDFPINEAAPRIGVSTTKLKTRCRKLGIPRWPQRMLKAIDRAIQILEKNPQHRYYYYKEEYELARTSILLGYVEAGEKKFDAIPKNVKAKISETTKTNPDSSKNQQNRQKTGTTVKKPNIKSRLKIAD